MKKPLLFFMITLLLVVVISIFYSDNDVTAIAENIRIESVVKEYDDYVYSIRYPVIGIEKIDETIENEAKKHLSRFEKERKKSKQHDSKDDLNVAFDIKHFSENIYSVVLTETSVVNGVKTHSQNTYHFDSQKEKLLDNGDIFQWGYVKDVSNLIHIKLTKKKDSVFTDKEINRLTDFSKENFPSFTFTEKGLEFILYPKDEKQKETINILLSYEELEGIVEKKYRTEQTNILHSNDKITKAKKKEASQVAAIPRADKQIALTFDDGPNARVTPQVLDILKKHHAKATFFVLGSNAELSPDIIKRMYEEGHTIGNHTWIHRNLASLSDKDIKLELTKTDQVIEAVTNDITHYLRPPYGSYNNKVIKVAKKEIVMWNIDPEDWKSQNAEAVAHHVIAHAKDEGIILMHDIYKSSADALDIIIPALQKQGYEFVPVFEIEF